MTNTSTKAKPRRHEPTRTRTMITHPEFGLYAISGEEISERGAKAIKRIFRAETEEDAKNTFASWCDSAPERGRFLLLRLDEVTRTSVEATRRERMKKDLPFDIDE